MLLEWTTLKMTNSQLYSPRDWSIYFDVTATVNSIFELIIRAILPFKVTNLTESSSIAPLMLNQRLDNFSTESNKSYVVLILKCLWNAI